MIKHLRIDNRLIHGQVAISWQKYVDANSIIVCNDKVALDPIQKMALPLAANGSDVKVFSIAETLKYNEEHPKETLFVIAKFPSDALAILESGAEVQSVNVGNAAPIRGTDYVLVDGKSIAVTKEDAEIYRKIAALKGDKLTTQTMPTYPIQDFLGLLSKAGF
ncbi:MAG: PTS sugar transporter subunit IIB [Oscillospiraceae bacterium]